MTLYFCAATKSSGHSVPPSQQYPPHSWQTMLPSCSQWASEFIEEGSADSPLCPGPSWPALHSSFRAPEHWCGESVHLSLCFICCASILQPTSLGKESLSPRQHSDVDFISHILLSFLLYLLFLSFLKKELAWRGAGFSTSEFTKVQKRKEFRFLPPLSHPRGKR